ncbi:FtsX-like permease family protein [Pedobacter sp. HMF7647]|uniref:FtsX-like permease family protein n=1 Tax=Hufsiella arboris TaxID=2695275 RepID=A0A7K1YBK1_9SPHI|nr:ABC transporter permease [Hufsiella arboris]MXV51469.1 FtsX-like permease family protein [Hufsiella arboris]
MLKNYFKIAWRNLLRNKGYSFINIFGLAVGLATCILIFLFVSDELSYNAYNTKADRIYRLNADFLVNGNSFNERTVPAQFGNVLVKDYPQIENATRVTDFGEILVKKGNETLIEKNAAFADANIFDIFTLPMLAGDPKTALVEPNSIVISERIAKKYFGSGNAVGKTMLLNNTDNYKVTGVIKDMPAQSHIHYDFLKAMSGNADSRNTNWMSDNYETYLLARPGTSEQSINNFLKEATKKYMEPALKAMAGSTINELEQNGGHFRYLAIPIKKIHLESTLSNEAEPSGNIQYVYVFIAASIFILLIACVNFMNLSTARSAGRSKEVGVRKVLGSDRSHLISQFLTESVLTSFISVIIALIIATALIPYLNQLSGKELDLGLFTNIWLLPSLVSVALIVGLVAGSYPAFFLSAFQPVKVLKGSPSTGFKGGWLRNSLVVFQFAAAIILIVGTIVIYSQLNYIQNKKLGYNREQVLVLKNTASLYIHAKAFKNEVLQIPGVEAGTITNNLPTSLNFNTTIFSKDAARSKGQVMGIAQWDVDADFIPTMGMTMIDGRNFSALISTDSVGIVVNESAVRLLGLREPIGKNIYASGKKLNIIGVVKDFNTGSLRTKIPPLVISLAESRNIMAFRVKTKNISAVIGQIENKYHAVEKMAGQPFMYSFLDDDFNSLYQSEQRTGKLFISFAAIAIFIACLGLFGLITYAAEQRTKEIGVRKVLGASISNIVLLLSNDFLKLVAIAAIIAFPLAWYSMNLWLRDFAYRIDITWWVFALAGVLAFVIAFGTVSFQAIKAAVANPVKSLRTE